VSQEVKNQDVKVERKIENDGKITFYIEVVDENSKGRDEKSVVEEARRVRKPGVEEAIRKIREDAEARRRAFVTAQEFEREYLAHDKLLYHAKRIVMQFVLREAEVIERFAQHRIRKMYTRGIMIDFTIKRRHTIDAVYILITLKPSKEMIEMATKEYARFVEWAKKVMRTAAIVDRFKYKFGDFEVEDEEVSKELDRY